MKTARIWPHKVRGEGHFVALLKKKGDRTVNEKRRKNADSNVIKLMEPFYKFAGENLNINIDGFFTVKGNNLYCLPEEPPDLSGIKVAKFGWYLGEIAKGRFEPSHSFALSLKKEDIRKTLNFSADSVEVLKYLKGETLMIEGEPGYTGILVDGYTLGWAKQTGDMLKNLYPKGWRKMQ